MLFILFVSGSSVADAGEWRWQRPLPQGNTLWKTASASDRVLFAVGDHGTILVTYDAGLTWYLQYEGVTDNLRDLHVRDTLNAFIVGDNGMILRTTDGGFHWLESSSGILAGLNCIDFHDQGLALAGGDSRTILRSTDGGSTWNQTNLGTGGYGGTVNGVVFRSISEAWATGATSGTSSGGILYRSIDSGQTWTTVKTLPASGLRIRFSPNGMIGLIVGSGGMIHRTTDGGLSWNSVTSGTSFGLNDIWFASDSECSIVGDNATLLLSTNAGATWVDHTFPSLYASLNGISRVGSSLVVAGEFGFLARMQSTTGWSFINDGDHASVNWITFANAELGYAVGQYGLIVRTTDGGITWQDVQNGLTGDSFYGASTWGTHVWIVGDLGVLLHSSDAGVSWEQQTTNTTLTLLSIRFVDGLNGWAVGDQGIMLRTSNGGTNWFPVTTGTASVLFGISFSALGVGLAVGDYGLMLRSVSDASWISIPPVTSSALFSGQLFSTNVGFCAGGNGTLLRTSDGGTSWTSITTGTARNIYVVDGTGLSSVWAVGDTAYIIHSTDIGSSWSSEFGKTGYDLFGLSVRDDTTAWIGGDNGTILATGSVRMSANGIEELAFDHNLHPHRSSLSTNFPNPFNPATRMRIWIAEDGPIRLSVFDLLGREIAILLDEVRAAGYVDVQWDARDHPSGVYYSILRTAGETWTRKLILLR